MILTEHAKEDFLDWCETQSHYTDNSNHTITYENSSRGEFLWYGSETDLLKEPRFLNALIIEWFDSVGIYVNAISFNNNWKFIVDFVYQARKYRTRPEALKSAIIEANETYNTSN